MTRPRPGGGGNLPPLGNGAFGARERKRPLSGPLKAIVVTPSTKYTNYRSVKRTNIEKSREPGGK